jgi:hypothetical protein
VVDADDELATEGREEEKEKQKEFEGDILSG